MWAAILVFFAVAFTDFCWTRYIQATAEGKAHESALFSVFIILIGAFVVLSYSVNHWLLIPAGLGAYVGTYFTVKYHEPKNKIDRPISTDSNRSP